MHHRDRFYRTEQDNGEIITTDRWKISGNYVIWRFTIPTFKYRTHIEELGMATDKTKNRSVMSIDESSYHGHVPSGQCSREPIARYGDSSCEHGVNDSVSDMLNTLI